MDPGGPADGSDARGALACVARGASVTVARARDIGVAWGLSLAMAVPLALVVRDALVASLGHSESGARMLAGWDGLWFRGWEAQATGLEASFGPAIVGIGAVFEGLDALVTGGWAALPGAVLAAAAVYAIAWVGLSGGVIARATLAADSPGLLRASARHLPALLPLAGLAALAYAVVFGGLLPLLSGVVQAASLDVNDERVAFGYAVGKYAVVWGAAWSVGLVHDYAKIMVVLDPRRGTTGAVVAAWDLVRRRPGVVLGVAALVLLVFVGVVAVYWLVAPGADQGNPFKILIAFGIGQASVAARIGVRCWGHASRVAVVAAHRGGDAR